MVELRRNIGGRHTRFVVWGIGAALGGLLLMAGFIYQPRPSVEMLFSSAEFQLRMGLADEATVLLEEVLESEPEHAYAHLLMGYIHNEKGHSETALAHYEKGREMVFSVGDETLAADYFLTTALLRLRMAEFEAARGDAERILDRDHTRRAAAFVIRAFSCLGVGDDIGFWSDMERAYLTDPNDPFIQQGWEAVASSIPWASAFRVPAVWPVRV